MAPTRRSALQLVVVAALSLAEGRSPTLPFSGKSSAVLRLRAGSTAQGPDNTFVTAEEAADASSTASSADVTSVDAATRHWLATVTSGKPDAPEATSALYAPDAKLWGTVRTKPFEHACVLGDNIPTTARELRLETCFT
jgi:hypothetical protein